MGSMHLRYGTRIAHGPYTDWLDTLGIQAANLALGTGEKKQSRDGRSRIYNTDILPSSIHTVRYPLDKDEEM